MKSCEPMNRILLCAEDTQNRKGNIIAYINKKESQKLLVIDMLLHALNNQYFLSLDISNSSRPLLESYEKSIFLNYCNTLN